MIQKYLTQRIINPILPANLRNLSGAQFLSLLIPAIVSMLLVVGFVAFTFYFLYGGIRYITSGSDKGATQAAKDTLTTALIGVVLLIALFGIINLLEIFFGFNITYFDLDQLKIIGGGGNPTPTPYLCSDGRPLCAGVCCDPSEVCFGGFCQ